MAATLTTQLIAHTSNFRTSLHRGRSGNGASPSRREPQRIKTGLGRSESHLLSTSHSGACDQLIGTPSALGVDLELGHASRTPISVHTNPRNIGDGSRSAKARTWFCSRRTGCRRSTRLTSFSRNSMSMTSDLRTDPAAKSLGLRLSAPRAFRFPNRPILEDDSHAPSTIPEPFDRWPSHFWAHAGQTNNDLHGVKLSKFNALCRSHRSDWGRVLSC
jgi:hypothetical protein